MSYPFAYGDETLWEAGHHSGLLYASLARGAADMLGIPSGLTASPEGGCQVSPPVFQEFVERLYQLFSSTSNEVLLGLAHGVLTTSLVLLNRAGGTVELRPQDEAALGKEVAALARSMA
ncbi:DUF6086 family protein [Streptomyces sp. NPDC088387]|uniref:DUF6086 family protein n=1 Tax=Streptomyces sp. NPDC088387 TaxID=3365859 RepID=UPI0038152F27